MENRRRNTFRVLFWCLAWSSNPGFSSNKNISSATASRQISIKKTLETNKIAMKSFCRLQSTLNFGSRRSCIKLTHTTQVVWVASSLSWLKDCNDQICMYVCMYIIYMETIITFNSISLTHSVDHMFIIMGFINVWEFLKNSMKMKVQMKYNE